MDSCSEAADFLAQLRFNRCTEVDCPVQIRPQDIASGYAIQDSLVRRFLERYGGHVIGYKIACTNESAQKLLNTDAPVFGRLLTAFVHPSPALLKGDDFAILGIEAEFAFVISQDVPTVGVQQTAETIINYVERMVPAIELVGHRFSDWGKFDAPLLISDNAVHQAWIAGTASDEWRDLDLSEHTVQLIVNGEVKAIGSGANVLGHPLNALAWLANELPTWGHALKAGNIVTTGTCIDVYTAKPGDKIRADFGTLGSAEVSFNES
ncbi:MAG: 2-keto-4-pentenoate hydratase [Acidiferrobacterales bacterium]